MKKCKQCKQIINGSGKKFCSRSCYGKSKETFEIRECLNCEKEFRVFKSKLKLGRGKYCSLECYGKHTSEQATVKKTCVICDKDFLTIKSNPAKCCSAECGYKKSGETKSGENHPMFGKTHSDEAKKKISKARTGCIPWNKVGEGITPKNNLERARFRKQMQKLVFERDDYTCQMCKKRGGYLQVDHIQPWAEYIELRFEMKNLRTLCMDCHYFVTFGKVKPNDVVWGHNLKNVEMRG